MKTGFTISSDPIKVIKINKKVKFSDGHRTISIQPSKYILMNQK